MFPASPVLFGIVCGYLAHQVEQAGGKLDPVKEKATLDNRLKSLIKWSWVEGQAEDIVNGTVDAVVEVTRDEADVKQLLVDLAEKDWPGAAGALAGLIAKNYKPTTDTGKLVLELALDGVAFLEGSPVVVGTGGDHAPAPAPEPSPLVTDAHVAEKAPA